MFTFSSHIGEFDADIQAFTKLHKNLKTK